MRIIILLFAMTLFACSQEKATNQKNTTAVQNTADKGITYPSVKQEMMEELWEKCDHVDYIFYEHNFSMSLDEKASIQQLITFVSTDGAIIGESCKPIGRITFYGDGDILQDADFYYTDECKSFRFHENGKPVYANFITAKGHQHYNQIFDNIKVQSQQVLEQAKQGTLPQQ